VVLCTRDVVAYVCCKQMQKQREVKLVTSQPDCLYRTEPAMTPGVHKKINMDSGHSRVRGSSQCVDVGRDREASGGRHNLDVTHKVGAGRPLNSGIDRVRSL
jgi:hypothetical protein